jgi:hypothetical protein
MTIDDIQFPPMDAPPEVLILPSELLLSTTSGDVRIPQGHIVKVSHSGLRAIIEYNGGTFYF